MTEPRRDRPTLLTSYSNQILTSQSAIRNLHSFLSVRQPLLPRCMNQMPKARP